MSSFPTPEGPTTKITGKTLIQDGYVRGINHEVDEINPVTASSIDFVALYRQEGNYTAFGPFSGRDSQR